MQQQGERTQAAANLKVNRQDQVLVEWQAPARLYRRRGKEYFSTIAAIVFLVIVISFVFREFLLIGVVLTLTFFVYILATVEPPTITNKLTEKGIQIHKRFYRWEELTEYWIEYKLGYALIHIEMPLRFPGRLLLLVKRDQLPQVNKILLEKLIYHDTPKKSWLDRTAEWLIHKVRLDEAHLTSK